MCADSSTKIVNRLFFAGDVNEGDILRWNVTSGQIGTVTGSPILGYRACTIQVFSEHGHSLDYGIQQFGGANPSYGAGIRFAIDPTVNARGEPTTFTTERHPLVFGVSTAPATAVVDVTNYLRTDAAGRILPGEHFIYLLGTGLSVVSVAPMLKFREAGS